MATASSQQVKPRAITVVRYASRGRSLGASTEQPLDLSVGNHPSHEFRNLLMIQKWVKGLKTPNAKEKR